MNRKIGFKLLFSAILLAFLMSISFSATVIMNNTTPLTLTNSTTLSVGQTATFLNRTIKMTNVTTTYQAPPVGNIRALTTKNWTAITYVTLYSTYPNNVTLSNVYFKALLNNPGNIKIYQQNTIQELVNVSNIIQTGTKAVNTINGTVSEDIFNTIITPTLENKTYWIDLSGNNVVIRQGSNQFKVVGTGKPGKTYDWEYSLSTNNLITTSAKSSALKLASAPITSITIDPTWTIPTGVIKIVNVSLNNLQTSSIASNTPVMITFNGLNYTSNFNGNNINFEVFNGVTGNVLPSWFEGNLTNEFQTNAFNSVSQIILWVQLPASIAASTNAVNAISLGFFTMGTTALSANTGIAPQIECAGGGCPQTTYAQYDNGGNVFTTYLNFSGTSAPTGWTFFGTQSNGITQTGGSTATNAIIPTLNYNGIESMLTNTLTTTEEDFGVTSSTAFGNPTFRDVFSSSASNWKMIIGSGTVNVITCAYSASTPYVFTGGVTGYATTANWITGRNYNTCNTIGEIGSNAVSQTTPYFDEKVQNGQALIQWWRFINNPPPQDAMPQDVFGPVQNPGSSYLPPSSPTLTLSNTFIDQPQSITFTAGVSNGNVLFTYNFNVVAYNTLNSQVIAIGNFLSTPQASATETWTWTPAGNLYIGNTLFEANVLIKEAGAYSNSVNTVYSPFGYNAVMQPTSLTVSNTLVDKGQGERFTYVLGGGTGPWTYNYVLKDSASSEATNQIYSANSYQSNSFFYTLLSSLATGTATIYGNTMDWATTNTFNTISTTFTANAALATPNIILSNTLLDSGQFLTLTLEGLGGTYPWTYNTYNATTGAATFTGLPATCNIISAGNPTCSFQTLTSTNNHQFTYNVLTTDSATTNEITNSIGNAITVNVFPSISISLSNTLLDAGQWQTVSEIMAAATGTAPFTANLINVTGNKRQGATNTVISTIGGTGKVSFLSSSLSTGSFTYTTNAVDYGTTTNAIATNSAYTQMTVNSALATPNIILSNTLLDSGQFLTLTLEGLGGTYPWTYNTYNATTGAATFTGLPATCNIISAGNPTCSFQALTSTQGHQFTYNVLTTDSATTNEVTNSISNSITVNVLPSLSITVSNALADAGQWETISEIMAASSGTAPFTVNLINITGNDRQGSSNTVISTIGGTGTVSFQTSTLSTGSFIYTENGVDYGTTSNAIITNSPYSTISVNAPLAVSLSPATPSIIVGSGQTFTATITPGQPCYTYTWLATNSAGFSSSATYSCNSVASNAFTITPLAVGTYNVNVIVSDSATVSETAYTSNAILTVMSSYTPPSGLTLTDSINPLQEGQTEAFIASFTAGTSPPYTYNFMVVNSITGNTVANQLITTPLSTYQWFWTPNFWIAGNTLNANVAITDTNPTTINTIYLKINTTAQQIIVCPNCKGGGGSPSTIATTTISTSSSPSITTTSNSLNSTTIYLNKVLAAANGQIKYVFSVHLNIFGYFNLYLWLLVIIVLVICFFWREGDWLFLVPIIIIAIFLAINVVVLKSPISLY